MKWRHVPAVLVLFAAPLLAAPPDGVRLPKAPPAPAPAPGEVSRLAGDQWYVIDSDVPLVVLSSPAGLVKVTRDAGPVKMRGRFVDGAGSETRTYAGKHVYTVEAIAAGRVELLVVPVGATDETGVIRRTIDVTAGRGPCPPPDPEPKPDPKPDPAKVESAFVIVVEDASAPRSLETAKALNDPFWAGLKPKHDYRHYLSTARAAIDNGYVETAKGVGYPAVLVLDAKDGAVLKKFKLAGIDAVKAAVKEVTK